jgi:hypothetical protein
MGLYIVEGDHMLFLPGILITQYMWEVGKWQLSVVWVYISKYRSFMDSVFSQPGDRGGTSCMVVLDFRTAVVTVVPPLIRLCLGGRARY